MKRFICLLLSIFTLAFFAGCGKKVNKYYTDQEVKAIQKTVEVLDDLLNYDISAEDAIAIIEQCAESLPDEDGHYVKLSLNSNAMRLDSMWLLAEIEAIDIYGKGKPKLTASDYEDIRDMKKDWEDRLYK